MTLLLCQLLIMARWVVLIWVVLSWIPTSEGHPLRAVKDLFDRLINPMLRRIRNVLPPVRIGAVGVDLSPLALLLIIYLMQGILC